MRTKNSIINTFSNIFFNLLIGVLGFIKVKVFVNGLSTDIYSLNQLFYQIFSYIAITELGIGYVINKNLYDAFAKNDKKKINDIYSTSKKFYSLVGIIMFAIALIISFFVKYLTKVDISTLYLQIVFIVFIIRNIIDYFFVGPRYIIEADQKYYKINYLVKSIKILEIIIEIALVLLGVDYFFILLPGIFITIIIDIYINKKIYKQYKWLKDTKSFNKQHLKGTKDVVWRYLASLLNSNTDIILISTFINPVAVIVYTSYTYITSFIKDTINIVSSAITPSYANLILKEKDKSSNTFDEINIVFLFIAVFVCSMLYGFLTNLIGFWVGLEFTTSNIILFLFCFSLFQIISEKAVIVTINSVGLFKETKIPTIIESICNFIISIVLIRKFGILGVLLGTIISKFITIIYNPLCIKKYVNKKNMKNYYFQYLINVIIFTILVFVFNFCKLNIESVFQWILYVIIFAILILVFMFVVYYVFFNSFRLVIKRLKEYVLVFFRSRKKAV